MSPFPGLAAGDALDDGHADRYYALYECVSHLADCLKTCEGVRRTLMIALQTAAMPFMMAMMHEPMAAKTVSICNDCQFGSHLAVKSG
jgi:hypothetical protein